MTGSAGSSAAEVREDAHGCAISVAARADVCAAGTIHRDGGRPWPRHADRGRAGPGRHAGRTHARRDSAPARMGTAWILRAPAAAGDRWDRLRRGARSRSRRACLAGHDARGHRGGSLLQPRRDDERSRWDRRVTGRRRRPRGCCGAARCYSRTGYRRMGGLVVEAAVSCRHRLAVVVPEDTNW